MALSLIIIVFCVCVCVCPTESNSIVHMLTRCQTDYLGMDTFKKMGEPWRKSILLPSDTSSSSTGCEGVGRACESLPHVRWNADWHGLVQITILLGFHGCSFLSRPECTFVTVSLSLCSLWSSQYPLSSGSRVVLLCLVDGEGHFSHFLSVFWPVALCNSLHLLQKETFIMRAEPKQDTLGDLQPSSPSVSWFYFYNNIPKAG